MIDKITTIHDLQQAIKASGLTEKRHAHIRLWFRGQADSSWKLSPGVYRPPFPTTDEKARLGIERHLAQDFRVQSAGILTEARDDVALYFLQQHYKMPTRLLDWSNNPLAALYFAVEDENRFGSDGEFFILDAYRIALDQKVPETEFRGIATGRHPVFKAALSPIVRWSDPNNFPKYVIPVRPDHFDRRVMLQKGCFTFHPPNKPTITEAVTQTLLSFIVPKDAKEELKKELFLLGIDAFAIYGDLDSLSVRLRFAHRLA
jgi:hypothetical protein